MLAGQRGVYGSLLQCFLLLSSVLDFSKCVCVGVDWWLTCVGDISMNASPILAAVLTGLSSLSRPYSLYHLLRAWKHWIQISQKIRNEILNSPPAPTTEMSNEKRRIKTYEAVERGGEWRKSGMASSDRWKPCSSQNILDWIIFVISSHQRVNFLALMYNLRERSCASLVFNVKQAVPQSQHPQGIFSNTTFCQEYPDE